MFFYTLFNDLNENFFSELKFKYCEMKNGDNFNSFSNEANKKSAHANFKIIYIPHKIKFEI